MEKFFINLGMFILFVIAYLASNLFWPIIHPTRHTFENVLAFILGYSMFGFILFGIRAMTTSRVTNNEEFQAGQYTLFWMLIFGQLILYRIIGLSLSLQSYCTLIVSTLILMSSVYMRHFSFYDDDHKTIVI